MLFRSRKPFLFLSVLPDLARARSGSTERKRKGFLRTGGALSGRVGSRRNKTVRRRNGPIHFRGVMPQIETWNRSPRALRDHLVERMHDRNIRLDHLNQLRLRMASKPQVPEGPWHK